MSHDRAQHRGRSPARTKAPGGRAGEAEADEAARLAHGLLAKHNLTLADVERAAEDRLIDAGTVDGCRQLWPVYVWYGAAGLYFCDYFYTVIPEPGRPGRQIGIRHTIIGRRHNIAVAKLLGDYLTATVRRLGREHSRRVDPEERNRFRRSFRLACARRLGERLWERRRETERAAFRGPEDTTLPALASLYESESLANRSLLDRAGIHLGDPRPIGRITHAGGAEAGSKVADTICLAPLVSKPHPAGADSDQRFPPF